MIFLIDFFKESFYLFFIVTHEVRTNKKRCGLVPGGSQKHLPRRKRWHVTVNTVFCQHQTLNHWLCAKVIAALFVTGHTTGRKYLQLFCFLNMNIVAGRTIHGAHPETFAQTQQAELVSMDFHGCTTVWGLRRKQEMI